MEKSCLIVSNGEIEGDRQYLEKELLAKFKFIIEKQDCYQFCFLGEGDFIDLCYEVVSKLKTENFYIERICYAHDGYLACLPFEDERLEKLIQIHTSAKLHFKTFEKIYEIDKIKTVMNLNNDFILINNNIFLFHQVESDSEIMELYNLVKTKTNKIAFI